MLTRLGLALFLAQSAYHLYGAALPLYFAGLGFDPTLIGLLIGATGIAELIAALGVGPGIDRFGGRRVLLAGIGCYGLASLGFTGTAGVGGLAGLRLVQGLGLAAVPPSTYSFVPYLVRSGSQTVAFATLSGANNVAMAICPILGLFLLQQVSPQALFLASAGLAVVGGAATLTVPSPVIARRPLSLTFQRAWLAPLLVAVLSVAQWGVIQTFVPLAASAAGANAGLLFTADAICSLAARIPAGWIADRYGPLRLALLGVLAMSLSPSVLLLPLNDSVLIVAGILNGAGAGLALPPMLAQLSLRSDESTRGTAIAYFSVAFALGIIVGASGGGLAYPVLQLNGLLGVGAAVCAAGLGVLLGDMRSLQRVKPQQIAPA